MSTTVEAGTTGSTTKPSFEAFFRTWHRFVCGELYARGVARDDIDDLVTHVFETVHQRWDQLDQGRAVEPWLRAVVRNHTQHYWRGRARHPETPTAELDLGPNSAPLAEELLHRRDELDLVHRALDSLSEDQRVLMLAVVCDEQSVSDAARDLGLNENTARSRLRKALDALRGAVRRLRLRENDR